MCLHFIEILDDGVLVSLGCCNNTDWVAYKQCLFLIVLEARKSKFMVAAGSVFGKGLLSSCLLDVSSLMEVAREFSWSFFIAALIPFMRASL